MAYPDIDALTNPLAADPRVGHAALHTSVNEALRYGVRKATVTLTSADILALNDTRVEIVAAPGAGKWLNVHSVAAYYTFGTTQYTTTDLNGVVIGVPAVTTYGIPSGGAIGNITAAASTAAAYPIVMDSNAASDIVDTAVSAFLDGMSFSDGDGTLTITIWYSIEDVPA